MRDKDVKPWDGRLLAWVSRGANRARTHTWTPLQLLVMASLWTALAVVGLLTSTRFPVVPAGLAAAYGLATLAAVMRQRR